MALTDLLEHIYGPVPLATLVVSLLLTYSAYKLVLYRRLQHIPGPRWTGLTELPHIRSFLSEHCCDWYHQVNKTYGPVARIGPKTVATSDPDLFIRCNSDPAYIRTRWFYDAARFDPSEENVFTMIGHEEHDARRKMMSPGYSGRENLELESDIDLCLSQFLSLLSKYASNGTPFDFAKKAQFLTLDVIAKVGFGQSFDLLVQDDDPEAYIQSTEDGLRRTNLLMGLGISWIDRMWLRLNGSATVKSAIEADESATGFRKIQVISNKITAARERAFHRLQNGQEKGVDGEVSDRQDMLHSFMRHGLFGSALRTEALLQIVAGSDTTGGAMRGILLYLLSNPRVYAKLQAEVDDAIRDGSVGPGIISYARTKKLSYLQAVVREGIRIFPPLTDPFARDVPAGGDTIVIDGKEVFLPGGTAIVPSWVAMHRDERLYGQDADIFRPERWLEESDEEKLRAMRRTNDLMFGHGKFTCLGKPVALIELHKTFFELARHFDFGLVNPIKPWNAASLIGLWTIKDMWVQTSLRQSSQ